MNPNLQKLKDYEGIELTSPTEATYEPEVRPGDWVKIEKPFTPAKALAQSVRQGKIFSTSEAIFSRDDMTDQHQKSNESLLEKAVKLAESALSGK